MYYTIKIDETLSFGIRSAKIQNEGTTYHLIFSDQKDTCVSFSASDLEPGGYLLCKDLLRAIQIQMMPERVTTAIQEWIEKQQ